MINRRWVLIAAVLASGLSAVLSLVDVPEGAVALLAAALAAVFTWIVLWARALNKAVSQMATQQSSVSDLAKLRSEVRQVLVAVQRTPSVTVELQRVYDRLVDHERPMPELGDWAMTASTLVWILDQIENGQVSTILECGSGSSTVWFALALERRGGAGKVISLDSSAEYAEETRARLADLGLEHRASVLHAPLTSTSLPGRKDQPWFDHSVLPDDMTAVDLLFVDGPVGVIASEARYPALPLLADRLASGALVVLDDTGRPDEKSIVKQWSDETHHGRRFHIVRRLDRSTVFATTQ